MRFDTQLSGPSTSWPLRESSWTYLCTGALCIRPPVKQSPHSPHPSPSLVASPTPTGITGLTAVSQLPNPCRQRPPPRLSPRPPVPHQREGGGRGRQFGIRGARAGERWWIRLVACAGQDSADDTKPAMMGWLDA